MDYLVPFFIVVDIVAVLFLVRYFVNKRRAARLQAAEKQESP